MLAVAAGYLWRFTSNVPLWDYWELVPALTGNQPNIAGWLWEQHNEHRIPLPKLVHLVYGRFSKDFRAGSWLSLACLAALSAAFIDRSRRSRGKTDYTDAFFPLALLHIGQYENLLHSFQIQFVLSATLSGFALLATLSTRQRPTLRSAAALTICMTGLALCGANGLALVPALATSLAMSAYWAWRDKGPSSQRDAIVMFTLAVAGLCLVALYFVGWEQPARHPTPRTVIDAIRGTVQFAATSIGPVGGAQLTRIWNWPLTGIPVIVLCLASVLVLIQSWRHHTADRLRIAGLLLFGVGMGILSAGIGWGRSALGDDAALVNRYSTLAVPLLCWAFSVWTVYGSEFSRRFVQMCLFALICAQVSFNLQQGFSAGRQHEQVVRPVEADLLAGKSTTQLAGRYREKLYPAISEARLTELFEMLKQARMGPYNFSGHASEPNHQ